MALDPKEFKFMEADPPARMRAGPGVPSELTKALIALEPGHVILQLTKTPVNHKVKQRQANARIRDIVKKHQGRSYETHTLTPGAKIDRSGQGVAVKELTLGIYRVK